MTKPKSVGDVAKKLDVIRNATRFDYPVGDIDKMLAEIEGRCEAPESDPTPSKIEP